MTIRNTSKRGGIRPGAGRKYRGGRTYKTGTYTLSEKAQEIMEAIPEGQKSAYVDAAILDHHRLLKFSEEIASARIVASTIAEEERKHALALDSQASPKAHTETDR